MSDSLRNLPVFRKENFSNYVPYKLSSQPRTVYVSTAMKNPPISLVSEQHVLMQTLYDNKRKIIQKENSNVNENVQETVEPPPKQGRFQWLIEVKYRLLS